MLDERVIELRQKANEEILVRKVFRLVGGKEQKPVEGLIQAAFELIAKADKTVARDRKRKAAAILRNRLVDYDGVEVVTISGAWPQIKHDREDKEGWTADDEGSDDWANDNEIEAAAVVKRTFRGKLVGENKDRDWQILMALAAGDSERKAEKMFGMSRANIRKRRDKQIDAIADAMKPLIADLPSYPVGLSPGSRLLPRAA
jgi:hypothetical protein